MGTTEEPATDEAVPTEDEEVPTEDEVVLQDLVEVPTVQGELQAAMAAMEDLTPTATH